MQKQTLHPPIRQKPVTNVSAVCGADGVAGRGALALLARRIGATGHCRLAGGATGTLRLSRDCALANRYTIRGTRGWLSWQAGDAGHFDFGLADSSQVIDSGLRNQADASFERCFLDQLRNVVAALLGTEELRVPAAEGLASIALIDDCYRQRSLMAMSWMQEREFERGRALHGGTTSGPTDR